MRILLLLRYVALHGRIEAWKPLRISFKDIQIYHQLVVIILRDLEYLALPSYTISCGGSRRICISHAKPYTISTRLIGYGAILVMKLLQDIGVLLLMRKTRVIYLRFNSLIHVK